MRSISGHIMPLVTNSLGRGHTHMNTHTHIHTHTHTNTHTDNLHRINFKKPGARLVKKYFITNNFTQNYPTVNFPNYGIMAVVHLALVRYHKQAGYKQEMKEVVYDSYVDQSYTKVSVILLIWDIY